MAHKSCCRLFSEDCVHTYVSTDTDYHVQCFPSFLLNTGRKEGITLFLLNTGRKALNLYHFCHSVQNVFNNVMLQLHYTDT